MLYEIRRYFSTISKNNICVCWHTQTQTPGVCCSSRNSALIVQSTVGNYVYAKAERKNWSSVEVVIVFIVVVREFHERTGKYRSLGCHQSIFSLSQTQWDYSYRSLSRYLNCMRSSSSSSSRSSRSDTIHCKANMYRLLYTLAHLYSQPREKEAKITQLHSYPPAKVKNRRS